MGKKILLNLALLWVWSLSGYGQLNPAITSWLQNTTKTGYYYMKGNSTPISHGVCYRIASLSRRSLFGW